MKIESTTFTRSDVEQFLAEMLDHDRHSLAGRLETASARLAKIGPHVKAGRGDGELEWPNHGRSPRRALVRAGGDIDRPIDVDDIAVATEKAKSLGATVIKEVTEVMGAGWLSIIVDPTGAALGLWKPSDN